MKANARRVTFGTERLNTLRWPKKKKVFVAGSLSFATASVIEYALRDQSDQAGQHDRDSRLPQQETCTSSA